MFAKYTYDVWGNVLSVTNALGGSVADNNVAKIQPFRYRSYYYDTESGLYYLQSRYYDPVTHRFVNADTEYISTGSGIVGHNMFAYCDNNPVNRIDPTGKCSIHTHYYMPSCPKCNSAVAALHQDRGADWAKFDATVKHGVTYSTGVSVGVNVGFLSFNYQIGPTVDMYGNIALQHSLSYSLTASCGVDGPLGLSFGRFNTLTNAPTYRTLEGDAFSLGIGASVAIPETPISVFANRDVVMLPVQYAPEKSYYGISSTSGISFGSSLEVNAHFTGGYTFDTICSLNIYDLIGG